MEKNEPKTGVRYYSNLVSHCFWYFTGKVSNNITPLHPEVTYQFEDVCGSIKDVTVDSFEKYFEVK